MTSQNPAGAVGGETKAEQEAKLPRRDWILLPILGFATMALLVIGTEELASRRFLDAETGLAPCLVLNDSSTGVRGVPNSTCWAKGKESSWTEYKFNSRGHRAGMESGSKDAGTYRIVMTGSSVAMGLFVPREQTVAALLPKELSQLTGRKVELYNTSIGAAYGGTPHSISLRFNEIVAAKPDMILWILTPWDIDHAPDLKPETDYLRAEGRSAPAPYREAGPRGVMLRRIAAAIGVQSLAGSLYDRMKEFRFRTLLSHYLFESQSLYVKSYLKNGEDAAGFLKSEWGPEWLEKRNDFDRYAAEIEEQAGSVGVPLVAVQVPTRAQAAMISMGEWPEGYDPYKIDHEVKAVIQAHGGVYLDIFPSFRSIPNPESHYMPVDGHPDADGHAMIAALIARQLSGGAISALRAATNQNRALVEKRKQTR